MNWRLISKAFVSTLLLITAEQWVVACSDSGDPYDYYPGFFQPTVLGAPQYLRFFYTGNMKYYDDQYEYTEADRIPDANLAEWSKYSGGVARTEELDSFIYTYHRDHLASLYNHLEKGAPLSLPAEMAANNFTKWFTQSKDLEALGYLMYAKQCQPYAAAVDPWAEEPSEGRDSLKMDRLLKNGLQLHAAAQKDFFKWRYAYQVLRMAMYSGQYKRTLKLHETLVGAKPEDGGIMYSRCLGLKAGALFALGRRTEAAYLYSLIFDKSDEMKRSAGQSFDWATTENKLPVLKLCKTPHEKAVVHILDALHTYEYALPKIQAAYELDPNVAGIDVVMVREINKVEERFVAPTLLDERKVSAGQYWYTRYESEWVVDSDAKTRAQKWQRYADQLQAFATRTGEAPATTRKPFWHLCVAYLEFVRANEAATNAALAKANSGIMEPREQALYDLVAVLSILRHSNGMTAETEGRILPVLQRLDGRSAKSPEAAKTLRDLTGTVLATAYLRSGDSTKAVYALGKNALTTEEGGYSWSTAFEDLPGTVLNMMSLDALHRAQAFARTGGKTPYEKWLLKGSPYSAGIMLELEGTRELRMHNFARAAEVLKGATPTGDEYWNLRHPFRADIREIVWSDAETDSTGKMTKAAFAKRMADLEQQVTGGSADFAALFDYATGLYSMTYYGKAYHAFTYYRSSVDEKGYFDNAERRALPFWHRDFYTAESAEKAYLSALAKAPDEESKARTLFMLAKCWQKRSPEGPKDKDIWEWDEHYAQNAKKSPYFARLKKESATTAFYREALASCNYLSSYARRK